MTRHDGGAPTGPRRAVARGRDEAVVALLQRLGTDLEADPAPDFREATRARLVAMAAVRGPEPARTPPVRRLLRARAVAAPGARWRARVTAGLAAAAVAVGALGTVVALSADARPGDPLYAVKRGTEQVELALAGEDRGRVLLELAGTRLDEVTALARGAAPAGLVAEALTTMDGETTEGAALLAGQALADGDAGPAERLADWSSGQSAGLAALRPDLPAGADAAASASLDLLDRVGARAAAVRLALACPTGTVTRGADELGPVPAPCGGETPAAPAGPGGTPAPQPGADPGTPAGDPGGEPAPAPPSGAPSPGGSSGAAPGGPALPPPEPGGGVPAPSLPLPSLPLPTLPPPSLPLPALPPPSQPLPALPPPSQPLPALPPSSLPLPALPPSSMPLPALPPPSLPLPLCLPPVTC